MKKLQIASTRCLSVLLCLLLLLFLLPAGISFAEEGDSDLNGGFDLASSEEYPEYSEQEHNTSTIVEELIDRRGSFERHFLLEDGTYMAKTYDEQVNFERDGEWLKVDNSLVDAVNDEGEPVFRNNDGLFDVSFDTVLDDSFVRIAADGYSVSWGIRAKQGGSEDMYELDGGATAEVKPNDTGPLDTEALKFAAVESYSCLKYSDVFPNTTLEYLVTPSKVKENIILSAPSSVTEYVIDLSVQGLTPLLSDDGRIDFVGDTGETIFETPSPYMYDSSEDGDVSYSIDVQLVQAGSDTYTIMLKPDPDWLNDSERVYPVIIDPTYYYQYGTTVNTLDTSFHAGDGSCTHKADQHLRIGAYSCNGTSHDNYINIKFKSLPTFDYALSAVYFNLTKTGDRPYSVMNMRRLAADWTNGNSSSYQFRYATNGGLPSYDGATYVSSVDGGYFTQWNITTYGTAWYRGTYVNNGLLLWSNNAPYQTFGSSEYGWQNYYPSLTWYYGGYGAAWAFRNLGAGAPNCYGYALGLYYTPALAMSLGDSVYTVRDRVIASVQGMGRSIRVISSATANIASNEYRFCMRVGNHEGYTPDHDYHFWVQTNTGGWAEKNGPAKVFHTPVFTNPSTASWDMFYYDSNGNYAGVAYTNYYNSDNNATVYFAATR
ncbi:MAG: hypothetical protein LBK67_03365 [Coriobacteriales bacterium]|jgi:hypothetical protein|nr:hypothetical protein [Coriobacteriales bacterium]